MRIGIDHLIVKALHAVEDVCWLCQKGPVPPSFALRFTLAFLFAHSHSDDREPFDTFWRIATDTGDHHQSTLTSTNIVRANSASREAYAIYKAVGVYRSTEMEFAPRVRKDARVTRQPIDWSNNPRCPP